MLASGVVKMHAATVITVLAAFVQAEASIDLNYLDESVDPCEDFHKFACGNFGKYHVRPDDQPTLDHFTLTTEELIKIGREILSAPKRSSDPVSVKKAKSAFTACLNSDVLTLPYYQSEEKLVIQEFGGMPLVGDPVEKISFSEIGNIAAQFGVPLMFQFMVASFNPEDYVVLMFTDSENIPEMIRPRTVKTYDEVLEESLKKVKISSRILEQDPLDVFFRAISKHLLVEHGVTKPEEELTRDLNDMKRFMALLYDKGIVDDDMVLPSDITTLGELQTWTEEQFGDEIDINWVDYLGQHFKWANVNITEDFLVYLASPSLVYGVLNLIRKTDPGVVKNFVLLKTFMYMAPDSNDPEMRAAFEEYYTSLDLTYYNRSDYCTRKLLDVVDPVSLNYAVTYDFINYNFDIHKIPAAATIINNVRQTFKEALIDLNWLDNDSRGAVNQKLDNIVVELGFPKFVETADALDGFYENLRICEWDNFGNARRIRAFKQAYALGRFFSHNQWTKSAFEVNAYAIKPTMRIISPASVLQSRFLNGSDVVFDYSRYGSIIAHEFVHHFDSRGIYYNELGDQSPLLSPENTNSFDEKAACFVEQYNQFVVPDVDNINGTRTLDENLADNGGLRHAFAAFLKLMENRPDGTVSDKYSLEQLFFINFATGWCSDDSLKYLTELVERNEHVPNRYRVLGTLANMEEFAEAFSCPVGAKMNPENKCVMW